MKKGGHRGFTQANLAANHHHQESLAARSERPGWNITTSDFTCCRYNLCRRNNFVYFTSWGITRGECWDVETQATLIDAKKKSGRDCSPHSGVQLNLTSICDLFGNPVGWPVWWSVSIKGHELGCKLMLNECPKVNVCLSLARQRHRNIP